MVVVVAMAMMVALAVAVAVAVAAITQGRTHIAAVHRSPAGNEKNHSSRRPDEIPAIITSGLTVPADEDLVSTWNSVDGHRRS